METKDYGYGALARIGEGLEALFPDLTGLGPLLVLGSGFRSVAVETVGRQVFRAAKNGDAAAGHAKEARLLPRLRARLPVAVPEPR